MCVCVCVCERERERQRQRHRERDRDRQTDRRRQKQTDRQTDRKRETERERQNQKTELKTETQTQTERASNKHTQTEKKYGTSTCCARFSLKTTPRPIPHTHIPCTAPVSSHLKSFVCSNSHMSSSVSDLTNLSPLARSLRVLRKSCDLPLTSTKLTLDGNWGETDKLAQNRKDSWNWQRCLFRFWPFCLFLLGFFLSFCFKGLIFSKGEKRRKVYFGAIRNPLPLVQHVLVVTLEWIWRVLCFEDFYSPFSCYVCCNAGDALLFFGTRYALSFRLSMLSSQRF